MTGLKKIALAAALFLLPAAAMAQVNPPVQQGASPQVNRVERSDTAATRPAVRTTAKVKRKRTTHTVKRAAAHRKHTARTRRPATTPPA